MEELIMRINNLSDLEVQRKTTVELFPGSGESF
jgi:hypothetical protein